MATNICYGATNRRMKCTKMHTPTPMSNLPPPLSYLGKGSPVIALPVTPDDMRFFLAHPDRSFRVRLANDAEISHAEFQGASYPSAFEPAKFLHAFVFKHGVALIAPFEYLRGEASEDQVRILWEYLYATWKDEYRARQAKVATEAQS